MGGKGGLVLMWPTFWMPLRLSTRLLHVNLVRAEHFNLCKNSWVLQECRNIQLQRRWLWDSIHAVLSYSVFAANCGARHHVQLITDVLPA